MIATDKIATVYANALLELAVKEGGNSRAQEIGEELDALCEVIGANKAFVEFLGSPAVARAARTATIERVLKGRVSDAIYRCANCESQGTARSSAFDGEGIRHSSSEIVR